MFDLTLVGIGTGNPDHLTRQAIRALNDADVILIPRKGAAKADLADLRRAICADVVTNPATKLVEFDLPVRDASNPDYLSRVEDWHDAIALCWANAVASALGPTGKVALLVWGDPSLYDSTLRIAARLKPAPRVTVIPGITSLQALCAAHAIALNDIGAPVLITTGRQLRDHGWPASADTLAVMLDGDCAFQSLDPQGVTIWWAGYVGMAEEMLFSGPLATTGRKIIAARAAARAQHGWIMDIYLLRRNLR
jgi:precorrin-6A synthase